VTPPVTPPTTPPVSVNQPLQGAAAGTYSITVSSNAAGTSYSLKGNGQVGLMGAMTVSGSVHYGLAANSVPTGTLTLSDSAGTIQLSLTGKAGPQPLVPVGTRAQLFQYTIVVGTGEFAKLKGSGTLTLSLIGVPPSGKAPSPTPVGPTTLPPTFLKGRFVITFGTNNGSGTGPPA
jgi:hypothetical protein